MLTFRRLTFVTVVVTLSAVIGIPTAIIAKHRMAVSVLEQAGVPVRSAGPPWQEWVQVPGQEVFFGTTPTITMGNQAAWPRTDSWDYPEEPSIKLLKVTRDLRGLKRLVLRLSSGVLDQNSGKHLPEDAWLNLPRQLVDLELEIDGAIPLTPFAWLQISKLQQLERLAIICPNYLDRQKDPGLEVALTGLPRLTSLSLQSVIVSPRLAECLGHKQGLKSLTIHQVASDSDWELICQSRSLEEIEFTFCHDLTVRCLDSFRQMSTLKNLRINGGFGYYGKHSFDPPANSPFDKGLKDLARMRPDLTVNRE